MDIICLLNLKANILPILPHVEHNVTLFFCQLVTTHLYILQEEAHHTALALLETFFSQLFSTEDSQLLEDRCTVLIPEGKFRSNEQS